MSWPLLLSEGIRAAAHRQPEKTALRVFADGEPVEALSYRALVARMNAIAHTALGAWDLTRGDRVAIAAPNGAAFVAAACGLGAVGIIVATPNPRLSPKEIAAICADAGARVLLTTRALAEALEPRKPACIERVVVVDDGGDWHARGRDGTPAAELLASGGDDFVLPYTSGTTGEPKGVRINHLSRVLTLFGMGVEYGCFGPDDHFLGLAPLCHGAGFAFNLAPLMFGGRCDLLTSFDPAVTARHIATEGPSGVFMVPTHFRALFDLPAAERDPLARHRLRAIISNAAALPQELKEEIVACFGDGVLHECYGSTEGGIVTSLRPADQLRKKRCVGLPFVNTLVRLLDDDGREVAPGEVGELFSYSPYGFSGYWNKPEKTRECVRDGWITAGDLAVRDDEGHVYIVDRRKDMVVSGGVNIYPRQVENVLDACAGVVESAVVGLPDPRWGERLEAVFVAGAEAPDLERLKAHCQEELGSQKTPKAFHRVAALPRNPMGKVLKHSIVESLAGADANREH